jgi:hypothetical protein
MTDTALRAIETEYRGYRFRSRTEARWAVALDAAGIEWQYEAEGFVLGGVRYLPDFYLPELKTFVEVKPTKEAAEQAAPLMRALMEASGCGGRFAVGAPTVEPPNRLMQTGPHTVYATDMTQCPFCDRLSWISEWCSCTGEVRVLREPRPVPPPRYMHALGEGQRARFEFGETGAPRPYVRAEEPRGRDVYVAGPVLEAELYCNWDIDDNAPEGDDDPEGVQEWAEPRVLPWREEIFGGHRQRSFRVGDSHAGQFRYAGPTIEAAHGMGNPEIAFRCLTEMVSADLVFCWLDRRDTVGTLAEVGAACMEHIPVFIAFANKELAEHFYFIEQIATVAVITPDVMAAWKLFERWQANT